MFTTPLFLAYWVHNLNPFIVQFTDSFGIRWYGVAYLTAFIIAALLLRFYYIKGKSPINPQQQSTLLTAIIIGTIVGGRLGYMLLYDFNGLIRDPLSLFRIWQGGMASHGGFIGIALATIWFSRKTKVPFFKLADIIVTLAPSGILLGRIANFINGYLWGKIAYVPWAVIFPKSAPPFTPIELIAPRHPSQLYAAFLEGFVLLCYIQWRFWTRSSKSPDGQIAGEFLIAYSILRFFDEFFRQPDAPLILGLQRGQFYSIFLCIAGLAILYFVRKKQSHPLT